MVLHHQHDDVPDLRQQVGSRRLAWPGQRSRSRRGTPTGQALHFIVLE
jgi:hypothetical protein